MTVMLQHVSVPRKPGPETAQQARRFYGELVGLPEKPVPDSIIHLDLIWFKIGEITELHVFAEAESDTKSGRHFCLSVEDVEGLRTKLTENGFQPWFPEEIKGRPRFFCRDPFEN